VFDVSKDRTYPPQWLYAPQWTAEELCQRMHDPSAVFIPIHANPDTHPEIFRIYPSLKDIAKKELMLRQELAVLHSMRVAMKRVGATGEGWLHELPRPESSSTSYSPAHTFTRACKILTVETALLRTPSPDQLLPAGFNLLVNAPPRNHVNRILTTQLPRDPDTPWDMVTDDAEVAQEWRRFCTLPGAPNARILFWNGPVASWPATLSAPVIVVYASNEVSRVGYLGALQEARYVLWVDATRGEGLFCTQQARAYMASARADVQVPTLRAMGAMGAPNARGGDDDESFGHGDASEDPFALLFGLDASECL